MSSPIGNRILNFGMSVSYHLALIFIGINLLSSGSANADEVRSGHPMKQNIWESQNPEGISFKYPGCWKEGGEGESVHFTQFSAILLLATEKCPSEQKGGSIRVTVPVGNSGFGLLRGNEVLEETGTKQKLNNTINVFKEGDPDSVRSGPANWVAHVKCADGYLRITYFDKEGKSTSRSTTPPKFFNEFLKSVKCKDKLRERDHRR